MVSRPRAVLSGLLLALGLPVLVAGVLSLYAESRVFDAQRFADEAVSTLDDRDVNRYVSARITRSVIANVDPDLVAFKPLVESAVAALLETDALQAAIRRGLVVVHEAVLERGVDDAVLTAANVGTLLNEALRQVDPKLARQVPANLDARLLRLSESPALVDAAQAGEDVSEAAAILPPLALLLLAGSIVASERRRRAAIRLGMGLVATGAAAYAALLAARAATLDRVDGETPRGAAAAVWDAFLGGLGDWALALAGLGLVAAIVGATVLRRVDLAEPPRRVWAWMIAERESAGARLVQAASLGAVGVAMVLEPGLVLRGAIVLAGILLVARAITAAAGIVSAWRARAAEPGPADVPPMRRVLVRGALVALASAVIAAAAVGIPLRTADPAPRPAPVATGKCNGDRALCAKRLDRVAFFATHNSYAGAGYRGFLFPEQEGTIDKQLEGGVRGLWIDTYYGVPGQRVYTQTDRIDPALNAQLKEELGPRFEAAAARLRGRIARPPAGAPSRIYLCHGYCELGAVDAEGAFRGIARFLAANPGEVLIIDLEDYTVPAETARLIETTGLGRHVYKGPAGPPWPTLREMIDSGGRVLIMAEHRTAGAPSWYRRAYALFQETPFRFKTPAQMSCRPNRGSPGNSLFLINNWIDTDPTPKPSNAAIVNAYDFLLDRARRCRAKRGAFPNVLNVDFWGQGDTARVVATLNGAGGGG